MKVTGDTITVIPATHDPAGQPIEPEQAPAMRTLTVEAPLTINGGQIIRPDMPGAFNYEMAAGEMAVSLRHRCATCKHFNMPRWRQLRRELEWSADMEKRQFVNEIRASIEQALPARERDKHADPASGELDIEHALDAFGVCEAMTEIRSREEATLFPVLTMPTGGCPDQKTPRGADLSNLYQPRDHAADRAAAQAHDKIMKMATGKQV